MQKSLLPSAWTSDTSRSRFSWLFENCYCSLWSSTHLGSFFTVDVTSTARIPSKETQFVVHRTRFFISFPRLSLTKLYDALYSNRQLLKSFSGLSSSALFIKDSWSDRRVTDCANVSSYTSISIPCCCDQLDYPLVLLANRFFLYVCTVTSVSGNAFLLTDFEHN